MNPMEVYALISEFAEGEHQDVTIEDMAADPATVRAAADFLDLFPFAPGLYGRAAATILEYAEE